MGCEYGGTSFKICRCCCRFRCRCLIPRIKKPHPPFNSGVELGKTLGLHPLLMTTLPEAPPPGSYDPPRIESKCTATSWKREEQMREFAETMGGHVLEKYTVQRKLMKEGRGPGTHEIPQWPDIVLDNVCAGIRRDAGFGISPRFQKIKRSDTPGPGYTGREHNPYYYMDKNRFKSSNKCLGSFEFDGFVPRLGKASRRWSLPCNRYNVKDPGCLESFLKKVTSKRGPYDLFTGPRDETTLTGYYARPPPSKNEDWQQKNPGEIDKMLHPSNYFKGLWTECPRYTKKPTTRNMLNDISLCYKDPNQPGPGHYDVTLPSKPKNMMNYPFDSNILNARPLRPNEIRPAPGRYKIKSMKHIVGHGWTWIFKSKVPRSFGTNFQGAYNSF